MASFDPEIKVRLNTRGAEAQAQASARKISNNMKQVAVAGDQAGEGFTKSLKNSIPLVGKAVAAFTRFGVGLNLFRIASAEVTNSAAAISNFVGRMAELRDVGLQAKWFNVPISQATQLQGILDDVKSKYDALNLSVELKQIGLDATQIDKFGHTINVLAAFTGEGKDTIEKALKNAQVTDRQLAILNKNRTGLEVAFAKEQAKQGGRALDLNERVRVMIDFLDVTKQTEAALGDLGKRNPFDALMMDVRTATEDFITKLKPEIDATAEALVKFGRLGVGALRKVGEWGGIVLDKLRPVFKFFIGLGPAAERAGQQVEESARRSAAQITASYSEAYNGLKHIVEGTYGKLEQIQEEFNRRQAAKRMARLKQQAQLEAIQEFTARQKQGRTLLRNFQRTALSAIAGQGVRGIGAVVGGMSQAVELARVFTATLGPNFEKTNKRAAQIFKLTLEAGRGGLVKLIESEKQRINLMQAQMLLSKQAKEELKIQNQIMNTKKTVQQALIALQDAENVLGQDRSKTAQDMVKKLQALKKLFTEQEEIETRLLLQQREMARIQGDARRAQAAVRFKLQEAKAAQDLVALYNSVALAEGRIVRDRGESTRFMLQQAALGQQLLEIRIKELSQMRDREKSGSLNAKKLDLEIGRMRTLLGIEQQRQLITRALAVAKERAAQLADLERSQQRATTAAQLASQREALAFANKRLALDLQRKTLAPQEENLAKLRTQLAQTSETIANLEGQLALAKGAKAQDLAQQLSHQQQMLDLQREQLALTERQAEQERFRLTTLGAFLETLQGQATNLSQKVGQELGNKLLGLAQTISGALGQLFTDMILAPEQALGNLGKAVLGAFGDMALQLSAFAAAQALLMAFTPGGQASAVGLGIAAGVLAALGGSLKAGSAAIQSAPTPTTTPAPSGGSSPGFATAVPGSQPVQPQQVTYNSYNYNDVPWRSGNYGPEQNFRDMERWKGQMQRSTGRG